MLYKENDQFHFYGTRTVFYDSRDPGNPRETFTQTSQQMEHILAKPTTVNAESTPVVPDERQIERLAVLNGLEDPMAITHYSGIYFVRYGYITPNSPLVDLPAVYHEESLQYLKLKLAEAVRNERKVQESAGTTFTVGEHTLFVRTDPTTQSKISSAKMVLEDPNMTEITSIDWELEPFVWDSVDETKIQLLANAVFGHVQSCFTKSKQQSDAILACTSVEDLLNLDLEWIDPTTIEPLSSLVDAPML